MKLALWESPDVRQNAREIIADAIELYQTNAAVRGTLQGFALLLLIWFIDRLLGYPVALRMLYVAPVWVVAQRGGRKPGIAAVFVTTAIMTLIDLQANLIAPGMLWLNVGLRLVVLYGLMRLIEEMNARIRTYSTLATRDILTGLANRLALEEFAQQAIERANFAHEPLTVAMIDCDRFKQINDTYGHGFGDQVLKALARTLKRTLQSHALVSRTGGDEFVIVAPRKRPEELKVLLDLALTRFLSLSELDGRCGGFSYGVAEIGTDCRTLPALLERADQDMYLRKANRAVVAALGTPDEEKAGWALIQNAG